MKRFGRILAAVMVLSIILFFRCSKNKNNTNSISPLINISGYVQKGPFTNGSTITVFDINNSFTATGKSFNTQIIDNKGSFSLINLPLSSDYAKFEASGFYFNEITCNLSDQPLALYCFADISTSKNININILTHLEKPRIEYLISQGLSFNLALAQAQNELLAMFSIQKSNMQPAEQLDISSPGMIMPYCWPYL